MYSLCTRYGVETDMLRECVNQHQNECDVLSLQSLSFMFLLCRWSSRSHSTHTLFRRSMSSCKRCGRGRIGSRTRIWGNKSVRSTFAVESGCVCACISPPLFCSADECGGGCVVAAVWRLFCCGCVLCMSWSECVWVWLRRRYRPC